MSKIGVRHILLCAAMVLSAMSEAQELNCNVQVNADKIQGSNKSVFTTLQQSISDFVNQTRWTELAYAPNERIECNMSLIVSQIDDDGNYVCEMTIQSRRPIYNTNYSSPVLNFRDKHFAFKYNEFDHLEYQTSVFQTNLTAMLAFYCYLIIGYDMDTYSRYGGTVFFQQCENIAMTAQTQTLTDAELEGWGMSNTNRNKNRYALINNLMDEAFKPMRNYIYEYHRLALDQMSENVVNARARIAEGLPVVRDANRARPTTYLVPTWLDAKADELVNIFQKSDDKEKKTVYDLLMDLDPTRQNTYDRIMEQQ